MTRFLNLRIAVIGAGNVGRMLLNRLRDVGVPTSRMAVCDSDPERARLGAALVGAHVFDLAEPSGCDASVWMLCMGPRAILPVLKSLVPWLKPGHIVVSFAAAVPLARLEALVPGEVNVVRVMPNMPSLVGHGMNPVCFSERVTSQARSLVLELLEALGKTVEVRDDQMNWCVGLSGAAMRSVLPIIEGMIKAGAEAGLSEADARSVAAQVMLGTAKLVALTPLTLTEIKRLTPMETLDETQIAQLIYAAAAGAKEKIDGLQKRIEAE